MTLTIPSRPEALLLQRTHRHVTCWELRRQDGVILRFTDHCHSLKLADGFTYSPANGGTESTAREREAGVKDINAESRGIISSAAITTLDLLLGKYENTRVIEKVVDWRYPWHEPFTTTTFWMFDLEYDGEQWSAQLSSVPGWMRTPVGKVHSRSCAASLGDGQCKVDLSQQNNITNFMFIDGVEIQRSIFYASNTGMPLSPANRYDGGFLRWVGGLNSDLVCEIKSAQLLDDVPVLGWLTWRIELWLPTWFDIVGELGAGDGAMFTRGCDGSATVCKGTFNNLVNFRGFHLMPGTRRTLKTPGG